MATFHCQESTFDLLESNMENISNELNGLLLANDMQCDAASDNVVLPSYNNEFTGATSLTFHETNYTVSAPKMQSVCYQGHLLQQQQQQQQQGHNLQVFEKPPYYAQSRRICKQVSLSAEQQSYVDTSAGITSLRHHPWVMPLAKSATASSELSGSLAPLPQSEDYCLRNKNSIEQAQLTPTSIDSTTRAVASGVGGSLDPFPQCGISYLRNSNSTGHGQWTRNSIASTTHAQEWRHGNSYGGSDGGHSGAIPKYSNYNRYNYKKAYNVEEIDYDQIVVNMEELGFTEEIVERCPILRIMGLFRLLNYYLHDEFPFGAFKQDVPVAPEPIGRNMNIQYHVRNGIRNCNRFMCDKERILNANKLFHPELYAKCQKSLDTMRQLCTHLEGFKSVVLEHKRCEFVSENWQGKSKYLELTLEQLNDQVRECNLLVHVLDWAVQKTCKAKVVDPTVHNVENYGNVQNNGEDRGGGGDMNKSHYTSPKRSGKMDPIIRYIG